MDGLLLTINQDFLNYCESRGLKVSSIRVRYVVRNSTKRSHKFRSFRTLSDYNKYHSNVSDKYNKIVVESMGGSGDNDFEKEEKIIKNISKQVFVEKDLQLVL